MLMLLMRGWRKVYSRGKWVKVYKVLVRFEKEI